MEKYTFVSIVIPAFNEESIIYRSVEKISQALLSAGAVNYEIIVVDDGSTDKTFEEISRIRKNNPSVKGIKLSRNFGKESALFAGLKIANGQAVITIDADLQHPPNLIPEMLEKWKSGAKIIHAVKRDRSNDSMSTRWRAWAFNTLYSMLSGISIDNSSDFKLLDRSVVNILVEQLQERQRFYRGLTDWVGFNQVFLEFDVEPRMSGQGKWSLCALIDLALTATISFSIAPLRIITILGLITLCFAFLVAIDALWSWYHGVAVSGFATLEISILIIGSFVMISLGIAGEYIAKIYQEVKKRPSYLVADKCGYNEESFKP